MSPTSPKVLYVAAEATPLIKSGGLADVISALPAELKRQGADVRIAVPAYPSLLPTFAGAAPVDSFDQTFDQITTRVEVRSLALPGTAVPVYLIHTDPGLHSDDQYPVSPDPDTNRFLLFNLAILAWLERGAWRPDIIHGHDWMAALIPQQVRLRGLPYQTIQTIHNAKYQGPIPVGLLDELGLTHPDAGEVELLRLGVRNADAVTTVSPTYAEEIYSREYGHGLEQVLAQRDDKVVGILNGLDESRYDPECDPLLDQPFDASTVIEAKRHHKTRLQQQLGLPVSADVPLFGVVSRTGSQKGLDLLAETLDASAILEHAQVVIAAGRGTIRVEKILEQLGVKHHRTLRVLLGFDDAFSHQIYAASDFLIMPSKYEPCGLTQMIAMRYGAIPVVRRTGGLIDTVPDIALGNHGLGITFDNYTMAALHQALERSLTLFANKVELHQIQGRDISQHFSWTASAQKYMALYHQLQQADQAGI